MPIAILATGDELIHGDTLNTNSYYIAQALSSEGMSLGLQLTCSDKESEIVQGLRFLAEKHQIIILTGGLGPTSDDLTRFALAQFTGDTLVQHEEALAHVTNRLKATTLNAGNLQQCLFPQKAKILPNPHGTAVGCSYYWKNLLLILLPGPPRECIPMFNHSVLPLLQSTEHSHKQILKWRIFGLAESEIAQRLEEALESLPCSTGYRMDTPYVEFKVRCSPELISPIKKIIDPILAPHIISPVNQKASDSLRNLILSIEEPITIHDKVTGGVLETLLITPQTYPLIHFQAQEKTQLHFSLQGLVEYWTGQEPNKQPTQLSIEYRNLEHKGKETHLIPYRSALVVHYAAEWLCFRLFHLINQLHQRIT